METTTLCRRCGKYSHSAAFAMCAYCETVATLESAPKRTVRAKPVKQVISAADVVETALEPVEEDGGGFVANVRDPWLKASIERQVAKFPLGEYLRLFGTAPDVDEPETRPGWGRSTPYPRNVR